MSDAAHIARTLAGHAREAASRLAVADRSTKDRALLALARLLRAEEAALLAANALDLEEARAANLGAAMIDRLRLDAKRIEAMATGVEAVVALPDPVGTLEPLGVRPNGLQVSRMRIPLGVICIIYESRPNVTVDAGALCIKSGNAPILKGGKEAFHSNGALVGLMRRALSEAGLPEDGVQAVATSDRDVLLGLIRAQGEVDLVIPRGGEGLIRYVTEHATVPVIQHYKGVCHVYAHADADLEVAADIAFNAKVSRPGVCNAMETLLIHRDAAPGLVSRLFPRLREAGVALRGDGRVRALAPDVAVATEEDWAAEYLDLVLAVRIVDGFEEALAHIARFGSSHTEAIVTRDEALGARFLREVNASCVLVNASTRFNDGFELGLGAEIGISTSRLHAFGPMGLEELTTRKFIVAGKGQVRT
jgi:glutamate-5-semialdehyde dehydrogenase